MAATFRFEADVFQGWDSDVVAGARRKRLPVRFPEMCIVCGDSKAMEDAQEFKWDSAHKIYWVT
jgi:hypothetical protein